MQLWPRDKFGEEGEPHPLSELLKSDSEEARNRAAVAILEKVIRIHAPFGRAKEPPPSTHGIKSGIRRLFNYLQSITVTTADFDTRGNRALLEEVVKALVVKNVHPYYWDPDSKLRLQTALQVLGKDRVDQIRYHPQPEPPGFE